MTSLTSHALSALEGISHGFGTRREPVPAIFAGHWDARRPRWQQVHGTACARVRVPAQACGEADALHTDVPGIPISVMTADCVPILLARGARGADPARVAAAHAGWRGTQARLLRALWAELAALGERPSEWVAAVGPAIGPCCYEVSPEIAEAFARGFAWMGPGAAVPRPRHLDLPAINAAELGAIGIGTVDVLRACTRCSAVSDDPTFHSYRREGGGTRQYSVIQIA